MGNGVTNGLSLQANIKESIFKEGAIPFILASFVGGMLLSLVELYAMMLKKEHVDMYFFGGMFLAGIFGIIWYMMTNPHSIPTALVNGIGAPQAVGGLVKMAGVTTSKTATSMFLFPTKTIVSMLFPFLTTAYASPATTHNVMKPDSISIIITVQGIDNGIMMVSKDSTYVISDIAKMKIPKQDSVEIVAGGVESQQVQFYKIRDKLKDKIGLEKKEFIIKVNITENKIKNQEKGSSLLRGMFAQQQAPEETIIKNMKIEVK